MHYLNKRDKTQEYEHIFDVEYDVGSVISDFNEWI